MAIHNPVSMRTLDQRLAQQVGHKYMTVLIYDRAADEAERVYSSDARLFPAHARKPMSQGPKMASVRDTGRPWCAFDRAAIERDYPDHQKIFALGCASLVNLPITLAGVVVGQVNLMGDEHFYDQRKVRLALELVSSFFDKVPTAEPRGAAVQ